MLNELNSISSSLSSSLSKMKQFTVSLASCESIGLSPSQLSRSSQTSSIAEQLSQFISDSNKDSQEYFDGEELDSKSSQQSKSQENVNDDQMNSAYLNKSNQVYGDGFNGFNEYQPCSEDNYQSGENSNDSTDSRKRKKLNYTELKQKVPKIDDKDKRIDNLTEELRFCSIQNLSNELEKPHQLGPILKSSEKSSCRKTKAGDLVKVPRSKRSKSKKRTSSNKSIVEEDELVDKKKRRRFKNAEAAKKYRCKKKDDEQELNDKLEALKLSFVALRIELAETIYHKRSLITLIAGTKDAHTLPEWCKLANFNV